MVNFNKFAAFVKKDVHYFRKGVGYADKWLIHPLAVAAPAAGAFLSGVGTVWKPAGTVGSVFNKAGMALNAADQLAQRIKE